MRQYQQLTREKRYAIYMLIQAGYSHRRIAKVMFVHHSTVSREIKRNTRVCAYRHGVAEDLARARRKKSRRPTKLTSENQLLIGACLRKHWSPEQVSGRLKLEGLLNISHETIYKYIHRNKADGGKLHTLLRLKKKYRRPYGSNKRFVIQNRISIDQRPAIVGEKSRVGDWELDTIISRKHPSVLISMVERRSRFTLIAKAQSKHSARVAHSIRNMLRLHKDKVLSITSDNGREFSMHQRLKKWLDTDYYFCHPYSSWERGLNENTNGLIRHYAPKGSSFEHIGRDRLKQIMSNLNTRPRKVLGYLTPQEVYYGLRQ